MTPRITLITAVAAAALVVGVPAAFGDNWGADRQASATVIGLPDREDRAAAARQAEVATLPAGVERSLVETRSLAERPYVGDGGDRFSIVPTSTPTTVGATDSGRELEWPQIGFGVGIGLLFALGLMLVLRTTRSRELAH